MSLEYKTIKDVWLNDIYSATCEDMFSRIRSAIDGLMDSLGITQEDILGAGAAVPGLYDKKQDRINYCTNPILAHVAIQHRLEELLHMDVQVVNDANLAALGQFTVESQPKPNLILLYFTEGIGLGIIHNGGIFHGATGYAGEIGNIRLSGGKDACRLEEFLNLNGILAHYKHYMHSGELLTPSKRETIPEEAREVLFTQLLAGLAEELSGERIFIKEVGQQLGWVVTTLIDLLNPGSVYIGGDIDPLVPYLKPYITNYVREYSIIADLTDVPIKAASVVDLIVTGVGELVFNRWLQSTYSLQV